MTAFTDIVAITFNSFTLPLVNQSDDFDYSIKVVQVQIVYNQKASSS